MCMLEIFAFTRFERQKSISLYLQANGIAATVLSLVSLERVLLFKLENIIPAALIAILVSSLILLGSDDRALGNYGNFLGCLRG